MTDEIREEGIKAAVRTFRQFEFSLLQAGNGEEKKLLYNLYIPENLEKGKKYPLVLFIHDMGSCSADVKNTLIQGKGQLYGPQMPGRNVSPALCLRLAMSVSAQMMISR